MDPRYLLDVKCALCGTHPQVTIEHDVLRCSYRVTARCHGATDQCTLPEALVHDAEAVVRAVAFTDRTHPAWRHRSR